MPQISLTDFVDFVIRSGPPKQTKVRQIKEREQYHPAFDFWRQFREGVREFHRNGSTNKSELDEILSDLTDPRKIAKYPPALKAYKKFLGRKQFTWFLPPSERWICDELEVRVNPELGLVWDGREHIIKLYFKGEAMSKANFATILELMKLAFPEEHGDGKVLAVLDVSQGKLHTANEAPAGMRPLLQGEARSFVGIWDAI